MNASRSLSFRSVSASPSRRNWTRRVWFTRTTSTLNMSCNAEQKQANQQLKSVGRQESIRWHIRPMRHDDIEKCLEIWRQVELTEAHVTVASVLATDPNGFYVAELEPSGSVIGMCSGAMTREDTAFMGFYAVEPEFQGMGIGRELWARTVARLNEAAHNVGLYGVPAMSEKYKKSGFKLEDSIRMLIYESRPGEQLALGELKQLHELRREDDEDQDDRCWRLEVINGRTSAMLIRKLIDFDERVNKYSRERLLRNYLTDAAQVPLTVAIVRDLRPSTAATTNGGQEVIREDEALSSSVKGSLSISSANSNNNHVASDLHLRCSSPIDIPSVSTNAGQPQHLLANAQHHHHHHHIELLGYGCIRHDNTDGAMIGPIYAHTNDVFEVILRELVTRFDIKSGGKYSAMSLTSNELAGKTLESIGFEELDQCSRMFTKFVPDAALDQVYLVHSPNFTLF